MGIAPAKDFESKARAELTTSSKRHHMDDNNVLGMFRRKKFQIYFTCCRGAHD
jgi:hypothetical protein